MNTVREHQPADTVCAPTVCLCMIVKNESGVIRRALSSVVDWIDYWVICDTGSTDNTPEIILETMCHVSGELHRSDWIDFGHNRSEVLRLARQKADYSLILDADMVVRLHNFDKLALKCDSYEIRYEGPIDYAQKMLVSNRHEWRFIGTTHEHIDSPTAETWDFLPELTLVHFGDGGMKAEKYERDIALLKRAHAEDPSDPRTVYYLAQSYRDLERYDEALSWYERRAALNGWDEERFSAMLQAGRMRSLLGHDWPAVQKALLDAWTFRPHRLEPLYELARLCRLREEYAAGFLFSQPSERIRYPDDRLFIDRPVYTYKLSLEHGICNLGVGICTAAIQAFQRVLDCNEAPDWAVDAAISGIRLALSEIQKPAAASVSRSNHFKVVVNFHNPGHFLANCVESLLSQDYLDFEAIFVDDASTDGSAAEIPLDDPRVTLVRNDRRMGAAANIHQAVLTRCAPDDIVVHLDGDDWLATASALNYINDFYNKHDCWVMYGQHRTTEGKYGICGPLSTPECLQRVRETWRLSHIKTYRAGLFQRIADQDINYDCLKDDAGCWLSSAVDAAVMFALVDLAGFDRIRYNDRVLYIYNTGNAHSVHQERREEQIRNFSTVQRKRRFAPLESYFPVSCHQQNPA